MLIGIVSYIIFPLIFPLIILIYLPLSSALKFNKNLGQRIIVTISSTAIPPDMPTFQISNWNCVKQDFSSYYPDLPSPIKCNDI